MNSQLYRRYVDSLQKEKNSKASRKKKKRVCVCAGGCEFEKNDDRYEKKLRIQFTILTGGEIQVS